MKSKDPWSRKSIHFLLTACLAPGLIGCRELHDWPLTYRLWDDRAFARFNEPADNPHLQLFQSARTNDVLVQYDEVREKNEKVRRRTFFLNPNLERLEHGKKPRFVNPSKADNLQPIPLVSELPASDNSHSLIGVVSTNGHEVTLRDQDRELASFSLPVYETAGGKVERVFLTPVVATCDVVIVVVIVGVAAGVIVAYGFASSGTSFVIR
jgi:hypothetical protein